MKKIILAIGLCMILPPIVFAGVTDTGPAGQYVGTKAQRQASGLTMAGGDFACADDATVGDALTVIGATTLDDVTYGGLSIDSFQTATIVTASSDTTITPTASLIKLSSTLNDITMSALPTFAITGTAYTRIRVIASSNTITLQDEGTLTGSKLQLLEATTLVLAKGDWCDFYFDGSYWYQDGLAMHVANNVGIVGAVAIGGVATLTGMPVLNGGADINEDVDVDFDAYDEEFNITTSSGSATAALTVYNSVADLAVDNHLLSLDFADSGDANGIYLRCRDNAAADTNFLIAADGNTTIGGTLAVTGVATLTAAPIVSAGKIGYTDSQGNLNYEVIVTTTLVVDTAFPLTPADGKAGSFIVQMGTHTATGTFTNAAVVSLGLSTADSAGTDTGTLAVYDGGAAIVYVKNKDSAARTATIRYTYVN